MSIEIVTAVPLTVVLVALNLASSIAPGVFLIV